MAALAAAPSAYADITVSNVHAAPASPLAGAHSDVTVSFDLGGSETLRDLDLMLPPGLVGNPNAATRCSEAQFQSDTCPASSQVGTTVVNATALILPTDSSGEVYNLVPHADEPARLGISVHALAGLAGTIRLESSVHLRSTSDYGLDSSLRGMPDNLSGIPIHVNSVSLTLDADAAGGHFMTNPTSCAAATTRLRAVGYGNGVATGQAGFTPTDCGGVPFAPTAEVTPGTTKVDTPSSYDISLLVPGAEDPRRQSHVRRVEVTLPEGTGLNAPLGQGLEGCTDAQIGIGSDAAPTCPAASNVGTAQIDTPLLGVLNGQVYLAAPTVDHPYRVFVAIDGPGLRIKLAGDVSPDPQTGRVTSVFDNLPQVPFTRFTLSFRGGDRAVLVNDTACGPQRADTRLTPWSGRADATPSSTFTTTADGAGAPCADPQPFAPTLSADTSDHRAGASPHVTMNIARQPGEQLLRDLHISLPSGLVGGVNGVGLCVGAAAETGDCPADSRVGTATAVSGAGGDPLRLSGGIFLSTGTNGAAASLLSVIPARVGPFDLGNAIVRSNIDVRPGDAGFDVSAKGLPTVLGGIPLRLRGLTLTLDRDGFLRNPTACGTPSIAATFTSTGGSTANAGAPYEVTGCDSLPFGPRLSATVGARGQTAARSAPPLTTVIQQGPGEAATKSAKVTLSPPLAPNVGALANVCKVAEYAADACPDKSIVGQAQAATPLLPVPLSGPVRVVENPGNLPKLVVYLNGLINIRLVGDIQLAAEGTTTTFASIPDVPLSRFQLDFVGGPNGLVGTTGNLCRSVVNIGGDFVSQSGKAVALKSRAKVAGCRLAPRASVSLRRLRTRSPLLSVRVKRGLDGRKLRRVSVTLPRGLSVRGRRTLRVTKRKGAARIAAVVTHGRLHVSRSLRRKARRHPKLLVKLRVSDVRGKTFKIDKRVVAR